MEKLSLTKLLQAFIIIVIVMAILSLIIKLLPLIIVIGLGYYYYRLYQQHGDQAWNVMKAQASGLWDKIRSWFQK